MITAPPVRTIATRTLGMIGLIWALTYVPIHVYWGFGGTSTPIGITGTQSGFRVANWGACVVIVGAGLTCLALTRPWGERLPGALRRGTAWVGGLFALAHWLLYTAFCALRVAGAVGYPVDADASPQQLRAFDWANLGYFELWFGVMGALLIVCARRSAAVEALRPRPPMRPARRVGLALSLGGILLVLYGVFTFDPWTFALYGPVLLGVGLLTSIGTDRERAPGIPARTTGSAPQAASQLTELPSSPQPAVPPAPLAPRPRRGGTLTGRLAGHAQDDAAVSRRAAYAAFGWVLAFLAWHVVWAVTGLPFPHNHWSGAARILYLAVGVIGWVIWAVGIVLPVALARPWGRRVPRWMLLWAAWTGCALLGARGIAGIADDVVRAIGFSRGLTGMTIAQVMGTAHPSTWQSFAEAATDVLFLAGGLMFGLAALTYQRAFPRRRSAEHPAR